MIAVEDNNISMAATIVKVENSADLILMRIRLLSKRRIAWLRKIWTELGENNNTEFNVHKEVDGCLSDRDVLEKEIEWYASDPQMIQISNQVNRTEQKIGEANSRISLFAHIFGLNRLEMDMVHICLALSIDPNLGRVFAYLHDHSAKPYITDTLVAKLFGHGQSIILSADSPLKLWGILKESTVQGGEALRLDLDPFIRNWLLGFDGIDDALIGFSKIQIAKEPLLNWPIEKLMDDIKRMVNDEVQNRLRIFLEGAEGSGRRSFAATTCKNLGLNLLSIDADRVPENRWAYVYMIAQRQAFLSNIALLWHGNSMEERYWPNSVPSYFIQFIISEPGNVFEQNVSFEDIHVSLPSIAYSERLALWQKHVPLSAAWPKEELQEMVLRHDTTISQIISIGRKMTPSIVEAYEALRSGTSKKLGNLAQPLNSHFTFDDLVVSDYIRNGIEDFIFEATERIQFWEQANAKRLFPQGRSLIGLFTGSPGTGKTMAAQVIAAELKLDIFRIDLSAVISKYVGESSKNIERILSKAKNMNVILFFDEADALFGKRTEIKDAHDRYANTDTNYLLQAIESYPGIVILASNKKSNIDSGFTRRLRYVFEFTKPDAEQRLEIWKKIIAGLTGQENVIRLNRELNQLSALTEITGAQIKQAVLSGIFMSRKDKTIINISYLLKGLERELAKEGKGLGKQVHENFNQ